MRIHIAYAVPARSRKASSWHDGFTAAVGLLEQNHDVHWLNLHPTARERARNIHRLCEADFLIVKSNWGWIVDEAVRKYCRGSQIPKGLMISGTAPPPGARQMQFYEALYFETPWYETQLQDHPRRVHAFGIDTRVMHLRAGIVPDIDWLSVGQVVGYKRHEQLLDRSGVRVVVGDLLKADRRLLADLRQGGVEVVDFVDYATLAGYYRRARNVLVNCTLQGGGERAVLEARACGATVHVADDNPKLQQLLHQAVVWDHHYYADQLLAGYELAKYAPRQTPAARRSFMQKLSTFLGRSKRPSPAGALGLCAAVLLASAPAPADAASPEPDTAFEFFVSDRLSHDDNLFRVLDDVIESDPAAFTAQDTEDLINLVSAGILGRWPAGRQRFALDLRIDDARFKNNDELDHMGGSGRFAWDWQVGSHWSGLLNARYDRALASFSNYRLFVRDMVDTATYAGEARYRIGSRWALLAGARDIRTSHSTAERSLEDFRSRNGRAGLEYRTPADNILAFEYGYTKAEFPTAEALSGATGRRYEDRNPLMRATYLFTEKTRIDVQLGYLEREHVDPAVGDFSGGTGNVTLHWDPRIKFGLDLQVWHELKAYVDAESDYFVADGGSVGPRWAPRPQLEFSLLLSLEDQEYIAADDQSIPTLFPGRRDRVKAAQIGMDYSPGGKFGLRLLCRHTSRESNRDLRDYDNTLVSAQIIFALGSSAGN